MNNPKRIDGDKLLAKAREIQGSPLATSMELDVLIEYIESDEFTLPSDQGEATRLKERVKQLESYLEELREVTPYGMIKEQITNVLNESRPSSHTEDTGIKQLLDMYNLYQGTNLEDAHSDYRRGVEDALKFLGITIPGITEER